jgi:Spy/CpxP family protein refolding chaperone
MIGSTYPLITKEVIMDRRDFFKNSLLTTAAIGMLGAGRALADEPKGHGYGHGGPHGTVSFYIQNAEAIGLSDDQVAKLKTIRQGFRAASARLNVEMETAEEQYHDLLQADTVNFSEAEAKAKLLGSLEQQMRTEFARAIAEGKKVLTADQMKRAKELRKKERSERRMDPRRS